MLTIEAIIAHVSEKGSNTLDGRDMSRLSRFIPVSEWGKLGLVVKEGVDPATILTVPMTREILLAQLAQDLDFGFEKALNKRGLSAGMMYEVVKMWMWVLEDDLQHSDLYAQYGLPFFKAVALKYGLENPIGEDEGTEFRYSFEADY